MAQSKRQKRAELEKAVQQYEQALKQDIQTLKKYATWASIGALGVFTALAILQKVRTKPKLNKTAEKPLAKKTTFADFLKRKISSYALALLKEKIISQLQTFQAKAFNPDPANKK